MTRPATVLAYHAVGDCARSNDSHNLFVTRDAFAAQMDYLARRRRVLSLSDALRGPGPGRPAVAITFDDGYRNVLKEAGPVLKRHGFTATVFVPTAFVGKRNSWIEDTPCDVDIMDERELQEVEALGVRVESHGHEHIDYAHASPEAAQRDLETSIKRITAITGHDVTAFAYPFGHHSAAARSAAGTSGIERAFTIDEPGRDRWAYERVQITPVDGMRLYALKTSGRYLGLRHSPPVRAAYSVAKPAVRKLLRR